MPTMEDLAKLATELYGVQVGAEQYIPYFWRPPIHLDTSKASSMGFTGEEFEVWSGEEYGYSSAHTRHFGSSWTLASGYMFGSIGRDSSNYQVVCLSD